MVVVVLVVVVGGGGGDFSFGRVVFGLVGMVLVWVLYGYFWSCQFFEGLKEGSANPLVIIGFLQ